MANIRLIKRRIKSAKNISQITKAMELVAASKMKKAQAMALSGRSYAGKIKDMVVSLAAKTDATNHPLLAQPKVQTGKILVILVSTNKGLCGGLNTNLFRMILRLYTGDMAAEFATIGKKGADFVVRLGKKIVADFSGMTPATDAVAPLIDLSTRSYLAGQYDRVDVIYNDFISAIRQNPTRKTILPLTIQPDTAEITEKTDMLIEPSVSAVFESLLPHYVENQLRDAILEGEASEHSARMVAMKNATDNAVSLTDEMTLIYNKARQEKITYEITDMVTARLAVDG